MKELLIMKVGPPEKKRYLTCLMLTKTQVLEKKNDAGYQQSK
jgi:hypothetical protein